ncbi:hypothetical protein GQ457_16G008650 [Hibiscus cannabinus]
MFFLQDFWEGKDWDTSLNHSFIALVSKIDAPVCMDDFRPVSLVRVVYKILSKILTDRLSQCMEEIISGNQFAFTKGRQILDCIQVANKVLDHVKSQKLEAVVFKIDFRRAYETVSWGFVDLMLAKLGFGNMWMKLIHSCISTTSTSILVNGSPTETFHICRVLRQGYPLSPLLFNIVAEGLSLVLDKAFRLGSLHGIKLGSKNLEVSHPQFVDDLIVFSGVSILGYLLQPVIDAQCLGVIDSTQAPLKQPLQCVEPHNLNNVDILGSIEIAARTELSSHAVEGGGSLNVGVEDFLSEVEMAPNNEKGLSWAESVDLLNNPSSFKDEVVNRNRLVESEEESFLPELVKFRGKKKYASLFDLQDEVLSIKEKRKRDRTIKKSKKLGKENSSFHSSRHSPSESDIIQNQRILKSAKKAMEIGNKVGIQFIGDEEEILEDFVRAELQHMFWASHGLIMDGMNCFLLFAFLGLCCCGFIVRDGFGVLFVGDFNQLDVVVYLLGGSRVGL